MTTINFYATDVEIGSGVRHVDVTAHGVKLDDLLQTFDADDIVCAFGDNDALLEAISESYAKEYFNWEKL